MKISEILHIAADEYLWNGKDDTGLVSRWGFSCSAIHMACIDCDFPVDKIEKGLKEMGLNPESSCEFEEFETDKERQAARYLWLKWAALMAEEQGV